MSIKAGGYTASCNANTDLKKNTQASILPCVLTSCVAECFSGLPADIRLWIRQERITKHKQLWQAVITENVLLSWFDVECDCTSPSHRCYCVRVSCIAEHNGIDVLLTLTNKIDWRPDTGPPVGFWWYAWKNILTTSPNNNTLFFKSFTTSKRNVNITKIYL